MFVSMGEVLKKYGVTTAQSRHLMILIYDVSLQRFRLFYGASWVKSLLIPDFLQKCS